LKHEGVFLNNCTILSFCYRPWEKKPIFQNITAKIVKIVALNVVTGTAAELVLDYMGPNKIDWFCMKAC